MLKRIIYKKEVDEKSKKVEFREYEDVFIKDIIEKVNLSFTEI